MPRKASQPVQPETPLTGRAAWLFKAHKRLEMARLVDISQADLAQELGKHEVTLGEYLRGTNKVPDEVLTVMVGLLVKAGIVDFPLPPPA